MDVLVRTEKSIFLWIGISLISSRRGKKKSQNQFFRNSKVKVFGTALIINVVIMK